MYAGKTIADEFQKQAINFWSNFVLRKKIKQIIRNFKPRTHEIKKEEGKVSWDSQKILEL